MSAARWRPRPSLAEAPDHGAVHGSRRARHHRDMQCANDQAATGGTAEPAGLLLPRARPCGPARRACGTSHLSRQIPFIPPNPACPTRSHLVPLIPLNPTKSRLSHLSRQKCWLSVSLAAQTRRVAEGGTGARRRRAVRVNGRRSLRCTGAPPRPAAGSGAGRGRPRGRPSRRPARSRRAFVSPHWARR